MGKVELSVVLSVLIVLLGSSFSYGQPAPAAPKAQAKDAKAKSLDGKSAQAAAPAPVAFWAQTLPKVEGKVLERYDINRDGILQTSETKIFLRDVMAQIKDTGSYNISDVVFLKAYDKNKDGILSKLESLDIKTDLEY